jgi:hypothetical protein
MASLSFSFSINADIWKAGKKLGRPLEAED